VENDAFSIIVANNVTAIITLSSALGDSRNKAAVPEVVG
jgi:hypothetical protein